MRILPKNKLFKKYLSVFFAITLCSFVVLGSLLYFFVNDYGKNEKKNLLLDNCKRIANNVSSQKIEVRDKNYTLKDTENLKTNLSDISKNINADLLITDQTGAIIVINDENRVNPSSSGNLAIPKEVMAEVSKVEPNKNHLMGGSTLGGLYLGNKFVVAVPILAPNLMSNSQETVVIGSVFAVAEDNLDSLLQGVLVIFVASAIVTLLIALIAIGVLTYKMLKPIREMSIAAREFSTGNFKKRIFVNSDDELGELGENFNKMAETLAREEHTRKDFVANVSHELRTPMTSIGGFVDGILDGTIDHENQERYLKIVSGEVKRLTRLTRSMLNLSKLESEDITVNKSLVNLLDIASDVLKSFETEIESKNIKIKGVNLQIATYVFADYDMMYQTFFNLIENALKFTPQNGSIEFGFVKQKGKIVTSITNTGEGVKEENLSKVFDRFYKTDKSRGKDQKGVGLGLNLVQKIIWLHGGKIWVKSEFGKSYTTYFSLPTK